MQGTVTDNNTTTPANVEGAPLYLRPDEAAKLLGISRRSLSNLQKRRVLPFHRIGRIVIFKRTDIEAALSRFRINAVGETLIKPVNRRKRQADRAADRS